MQTLTELKTYAVANVGYQLNWELMDSNPEYRGEIERAIRKGAELQAELEPLYMKLTASDMVKLPTVDAYMSQDELTYYREVVRQELAACYRLEVLASTYRAINDIITPLTDES
jgi:hypothetical protein